MSELRILLHDEVQLLDWGETRAGGPYVKLRLRDPEMLEVFRGMDTATAKRTGHIFNMTLAEGDIAEIASEPAPDASHGHFWRDLMRSSFFNAPPVLRAIAPESVYEGWIRKRPSWVSGEQDWDSEKGEGRCEPCHVRVVEEGSGTAIKPPYFCVPMTHCEHELQHRSGYAAVLGLDDSDLALQQFTNHARGLRIEWASKHLAHLLRAGCKSRSEVSPDEVRRWVEENGLTSYLPAALRASSP